MRTLILVLLLLVTSITTSPTHAGVLSRGNIFAEGLTGCSLGIAVGIISIFVMTSQAPLASATTANNIGWIGYCLIGGTFAVVVHKATEFSGMDNEFFRLNGAMEEKAPMIYPATPGKEY